MLVIISPAKTLDFKSTNLNLPISKPIKLDRAKEIMKELKKYDTYSLEKLMKISNKLARVNIDRINKWKGSLENTNHALLSYTGEVFRGIDAKSMSDAELFYADNHLRILSGLYGVVKPLDGIEEYRLEMCTKLQVGIHKDLYEYWNNEILEEIEKELMCRKNKLLVNLASYEYYKVVEKLKDYKDIKVVTPVFMEPKLDGYKIVTMKAKKARGLMVRYIIENKVDNIEMIKKFNVDNYLYNEDLSDDNNIVFIHE